MIQNDQNEQLIKIGNWISPRLDKYEFIIVIVFLTALLFKMSTDLEISILIVLSLMSLSILYFFNAFSCSNDEKAGGVERFIVKLVSLSGSIVSIGILFRLEHWPGYNAMLISGCATLVILFPIIIIIKSKKPELSIFNQRLLIRIILIASLGLFINFAPKDTLIKIGLDKKINIERAE